MIGVEKKKRIFKMKMFVSSPYQILVWLWFRLNWNVLFFSLKLGLVNPKIALGKTELYFYFIETKNI